MGFQKTLLRLPMKYNFEKIDENQKKIQTLTTTPEIDKRTKIIAGYMYDIYVNNMGY